MKFNEKVIFVRVKLNISQNKLADLLCVSLTTINRWRNEKVESTRKDKLLFKEFCRVRNILFNEVY